MAPNKAFKLTALRAAAEFCVRQIYMNKMKKFELSLSRSDATEELKNSLRSISSSAIRCFDATDCYGDVHEDEKVTTFTIGLGPTCYTTANGRIEQIDKNKSYISYEFKGPFWSFLVRDSINTHIKQVFGKHIIK